MRISSVFGEISNPMFLSSAAPHWKSFLKSQEQPGGGYRVEKAAEQGLSVLATLTMPPPLPPPPRQPVTSLPVVEENMIMRGDHVLSSRVTPFL